jgi:DNA helicase HerA-like ATPase
MATAVEELSNLVIGVVEAVAPNEIKVQLDLEAPYVTALNVGTPTAFPRVNGYVLIPNEAGATVGYISWIGIERSPYPKRAGLQDFGLVDLPFPLRKMSIAPVGTLTLRRERTTRATRYELSRGVLAFPSVGDQVLIPTPEQIESIVGAQESDRRVRIGSSPLAANAAIMVDPDKLFGRHLAVLGNTGSGKSCTVAGLIRWAIEAAETVIAGKAEKGVANARFLILDPNGEYSKAFSDFGNRLRLFRVPPVGGYERPLDVPAWAWNGHEWTAVAHAQPGAQRPLLLQGLRELKSGEMEDVPREAVIRRYLVSYNLRISELLSRGTNAFAGSPAARFTCARLFERIVTDATEFAASVGVPVAQKLTTLAQNAKATLESRRSTNPNFFEDFAVSDLEAVREELKRLASELPEIGGQAPTSEDAPLHFDVNLLAPHLERIAIDQGGNVAGFISTLGLRIRGMLADQRLGSVINRQPPTSFDNWLKDYIGADGASNGPLAVIDLSLVPSEIIHVVMAVLARLVFEAMQRYRRQHAAGKALPTVLVLEEAHTFIRRGGEDDDAVTTPARLCREAFERIAREGRKFGLGLVLSSQRPYELSPTVLAQCNTFILHRIVNDADQNLVSRLVPDNVGGLLKELPSLPSRQAILLGWAAPIPILMEVDELAEAQRPRSSDPDFWNVWTLAEERRIDWHSVAAEWSRAGNASQDD